MLEVDTQEIPSCTAGLPTFTYSSNLTSLPYLTDYDIDEQIPQTIFSRYYSVSELTSINYNAHDFSILHSNIRSLSLHCDDIVNLCAQVNMSFDIIDISETWNSTQNEILNNIKINGYSYYETKSTNQNGGVGIYVKNSLSSRLRPDLSFTCSSFEIVWVELENKNKKNFLIDCVYRHPSSDINILLDYFTSFLPKPTSKQAFLMGDFNIDLLKYNSNALVNDFVNTFLSNNYLPCINHSTRITEHSSTIIDNIFTNISGSEIISGNILAQISYHLPQFLILKNADMHHTKSVEFKYDYSSFCERAFLEDFNCMDFSYIDSSTKIEINLNKFFEEINLLIERHVPVKECNKKELKFKLKPWISYRIQRMMKIRDRLLRKMRKDRSRYNCEAYKKVRNRVTNEIRNSKKTYFQIISLKILKI